jgi:hypothetical protein
VAEHSSKVEQVAKPEATRVKQLAIFIRRRHFFNYYLRDDCPSRVTTKDDHSWEVKYSFSKARSIGFRSPRAPEATYFEDTGLTQNSSNGISQLLSNFAYVTVRCSR